jgi:hypothetical protein
VGLNPDMASWLNEQIAKQREKIFTQEVDMAKVLLVAKCLSRERKQLEKENLKWSELHKKARASAQKNTARIKDLLEENLKLTNSTVTLRSHAGTCWLKTRKHSGSSWINPIDKLGAYTKKRNQSHVWMDLHSMI